MRCRGPREKRVWVLAPPFFLGYGAPFFSWVWRPLFRLGFGAPFFFLGLAPPFLGLAPPFYLWVWRPLFFSWVWRPLFSHLWYFTCNRPRWLPWSLGRAGLEPGEPPLRCRMSSSVLAVHIFLISERTEKSSPEIRRPRVERAQLDSLGSGLLTRQLADPTEKRRRKMHQIDSLKHQRRALSFRVRRARSRRQAYTATTPVRGDETPGRQLVGYRHLRNHHLRRLPSGLGSSTTLHVPNTVG